MELIVDNDTEKVQVSCRASYLVLNLDYTYWIRNNINPLIPNAHQRRIFYSAFQGLYSRNLYRAEPLNTCVGEIGSCRWKKIVFLSNFHIRAIKVHVATAWPMWTCMESNRYPARQNGDFGRNFHQFSAHFLPIFRR